jgi:hypothetical protein
MIPLFYLVLTATILLVLLRLSKKASS